MSVDTRVKGRKSWQPATSRQSDPQRASKTLGGAENSFSLEKVLWLCAPGCLRVENKLFAISAFPHGALYRARLCLQLVKAVSGAVVGLRDQLEALTILDETALTWPGLSLVSHVISTASNQRIHTLTAASQHLVMQIMKHSVKHIVLNTA